MTEQSGNRYDGIFRTMKKIDDLMAYRNNITNNIISAVQRDPEALQKNTLNNINNMMIKNEHIAANIASLIQSNPEILEDGRFIKTYGVNYNIKESDESRLKSKL